MTATDLHTVTTDTAPVRRGLGIAVPSTAAPQRATSPRKNLHRRLSRPARALLIGVMLALMATPVGARAASARPAARVSCGDTIVSSTRLTRDLLDCPDNGLVIGADDVTLDLNGHTLGGDDSPQTSCPDDESCDVGVDNTAGHNGLRVLNGTVSRFGIGVLITTAAHNSLYDLRVMDNADIGTLAIDTARTTVSASSFAHDGVSAVVFVDSDAVMVRGNTVAGSSGFGIGLFGTDDSLVRDNALAENEHGIAIQQDSSRNTVRANVLTHTGGSSIDIGGGDVAGNRILRNRLADNGDGIIVGHARHTLIDRNVVTGTGFFGPPEDSGGFSILLDGSTNNTVSRNTVEGGRGPDIWVTAMESPTPAANNLISRNTANGSLEDGIRIDQRAEGTLIDRNTAAENGDDGIDVDAPATTVTRNTANENGDLGIEAILGVTDGGGNRARGNGNPINCSHVRCS